MNTLLIIFGVVFLIAIASARASAAGERKAEEIERKNRQKTNDLKGM